MKIIYITGCLGFIGSYFTRKALKMGWKVFGVDKITYAANRNLLKEFSTYENFTFRQTDIKDLDHLYDCDYIVNFAAESHVDNSILNSDQFVNSNILGVKNLLELVRSKSSNSGSKPIFFQISTDEVYGDIVDGEHIESDILKPSNPYSASKASADMLINAWARTYGVDYLILRPTNNYGIGQYPEKLIPLSVKNLMRNRKVRLHNDGTPVRNWLHADDTAEAVLSLIIAGVKNEIFNVAGGFEQSNLDTVKKIVGAYCGSPANTDDLIDFSYSRDGQDMRYALNDDKLRRLGWSPKKVFDNEIQSIVDYYKENFIW
jgi:dTDP-glucose 4,6-dehydratase